VNSARSRPNNSQFDWPRGPLATTKPCDVTTPDPLAMFHPKTHDTTRDATCLRCRLPAWGPVCSGVFRSPRAWAHSVAPGRLQPSPLLPRACPAWVECWTAVLAARRSLLGWAMRRPSVSCRCPHPGQEGAISAPSHAPVSVEGLAPASPETGVPGNLLGGMPLAGGPSLGAATPALDTGSARP
jgi:hypothetical protein